MSKKFILYLTLFVATMLTACGSVPEPAQQDVLKALEEKGYVTEEGVENGEYTVQINETKVSDSGEKATIECVVSHENEVVRTSTEYKIKFELGDDEELWEVKSAYSKGCTWELINTIQDDNLKDLLQREKLSVDDEYIYFNDSHITYTVSNHEVNNDEMTDVVTLKVSGSLGYKNVTATVKYTVCYVVAENCWKIQGKEIDSIESTLVEGYEVDFSAERVWADVLGKNNFVYVLGDYYFWEDESITTSNIKMGESVYAGSYRTVPLSVTVNYKNLSFDVNYNAEYCFNAENKWEFKRLKEIKYDDFICDFIGAWKGTLENDQVEFVIDNVCHETEKSCLNVNVDITMSTGAAYRYSAYVKKYDPSSGYIEIYPCEVLGEAPEGSYLMVFAGYCKEGVFTPYVEYDNFLFEKVD